MEQQRSPLVYRGYLRKELVSHASDGSQDTVTPPTFLTTTTPVISEDTIIVAATHPNLKSACGVEDGWFLSDFYAFNALLHGLGSRQTWLTAADPIAVIEKYGPVLHGNPYQERKVVLSRELLESDRLSCPTVVKTADLIDRFVEEAKLASEEGRRRDAPVLLLVFCHGHPNSQLLLDNGNRSRGLSIQRLKGVLEPGARVALVTTACHSGRWAISPDLNSTAMVAADADSRSTSWPLSHSIGRACGSIFASSVIRALDINTSEDATAPPKQKDAAGTEEDVTGPNWEDKEEVRTYNEFCSSILEVCRTDITRLWDHHSFTFSAQDDQWEWSWLGRTGIPHIDFGARWNSLPSHPYQGAASVQEVRDQSPSNPAFSLDNITSMTGGIQLEPMTDDELIDKMTTNLRHGRTREMARLFLSTCPGDWTEGWNVSTGGLLHDHVNGVSRIDEDESDSDDGWYSSDIVEVMKFRWDYTLMADHVVAIYGLPKPRGSICITWDIYPWRREAAARIPDVGAKYSMLWQALVDGNCMLEPARGQGMLFERPLAYLAAAVTEADLGKEASMQAVGRISAYFARVQQFLVDRARGTECVQQRRRSWLHSAARRVRRSLSPHKKSSTSGGSA